MFIVVASCFYFKRTTLPAIPSIAVHSIFVESTGTFEDVSNCGTDQRRFL